ncbi:MAG: thioesterase family protein [Solirubrobacteraceae bacterium]
MSAVEAEAPGRLNATIDPDWTIGGKPNGGYLLAMLGRAAASVSPHPDILSASAYYLQAPQPGRVTLDAQLLRRGRSASQVRAWLSQDDQVCVEALFMAGRLDPAASPHWADGLPDTGQADYKDCPRLVPRSPNGNPVSIMEQIEVRLEPGSRGFIQGKPSGRGELRGWLALPGGEDFDPVSLLFAVDAFPPGTFEIEFAGWVPTLELTVYVRALPAPGPVRVLQRAELIDGQRVDESCYIWDCAGRLVAQGRQLAGIRLG